MERSIKPLADGFAKFCEHTLIDLPLTFVVRIFGDRQAALPSKAWQAYDSWIALTNEATNQLYSNRLFADASGFALEASLRMQQMDFLPSTGKPRRVSELPETPPIQSENQLRPARRASNRNQRRMPVRKTSPSLASGARPFAPTGTD